MEVVLVVLVMLLVAGVPLAVAIGPLVVMAVRHRWTVPSVGAWLLGLVLLGFWSAAGSADMDRADATGGQGSILAGVGWLVAAVAAAVAAVVLTRRRDSGVRTR